MNFLLCGDKNAPPLLLIHGLGCCAERIYGKLARALGKRYRVIMPCLDGHDPYYETTFDTVETCCEHIERYITKNFGGSVYGISGFSLGGTVALALMERGTIKAQRLHLDGALCADPGLMKTLYKLYYTKGFQVMAMGIKLPDKVTEFIFGKGNKDVYDLFEYEVVMPESLENACRDLYSFKLSPKISECGAAVEYWCGSSDAPAKKSARKLEGFFPEMRVRVFKDIGHGQLLREHTKFYYRELRKFLEGKE